MHKLLVITSLILFSSMLVVAKPAHSLVRDKVNQEDLQVQRELKMIELQEKIIANQVELLKSNDAIKQQLLDIANIQRQEISIQQNNVEANSAANGLLKGIQEELVKQTAAEAGAGATGSTR